MRLSRVLAGLVAIAMLWVMPGVAGAAGQADAGHGRLASVLQDDCSYSGTWGTGFSVGDTVNGAVAILNQDGAALTGAYQYIDGSGATGTVTGSVNGMVASGSWSQGDSGGQFIMTMEADCNSWNGSWGNGGSPSDGGLWVGLRA